MPENFIAKIEHALNKGLEEGVYPGAVLLVGRKGKVLFLQAVGHASIRPAMVKMREDTIFDLASLTKPLATALAVMKLVDKGVLHLESPLKDLLPAKVPMDKASITLRQLLSHSAGLPDWKPFYREVQDMDRKTRKQKVWQLILETKLVHSPGQKALYSDLGYMLLEWLVEASSGKSLPDFVGPYFYEPLGLKRTFFQETDAPIKFDLDQYAATEDCPWRGKVVQGVVHDENAYTMGGYSGHAGLFSTAPEVHVLCHTLLEHYQGKRNDLLSPFTAKSFLSPQCKPMGTTWALGWDTPSPTGSSAGQHFSSSSVGHLGFTGTSIWMDLKKELIVVLLTNRIHLSRKNEKIRIFRPYLHDLIAEWVGCD